VALFSEESGKRFQIVHVQKTKQTKEEDALKTLRWRGKVKRTKNNNTPEEEEEEGGGGKEAESPDDLLLKRWLRLKPQHQLEQSRRAFRQVVEIAVQLANQTNDTKALIEK